MNFSFVLPTRGEPQAVFKMLDAFERTTKYKDKIEVLLAIDEGKTGIIQAVQKRVYSYSIQFFERPITEDFTNDYYNWLANRTVGKNVGAFNDDAWMRTNHWDAKILKTINQYGSNVYMLDVPDTARIKYGQQFPCFPIVSRRAFCTLGWLLNPQIPVYPADKVTHSIYHAVNRVIPIRDVIIEHEHDGNMADSRKRMMGLFLKQQEKFQKDINGIPQLNVGNDILKLSVLAQSDKPLKLKKWVQIWNVLRQ